jgi:hypothetical protein
LLMEILLFFARRSGRWNDDSVLRAFALREYLLATGEMQRAMSKKKRKMTIKKTPTPVRPVGQTGVGKCGDALSPSFS